MITLRGMAEHTYSNVYNNQCLTLVLYFYMWILISPQFGFPLIYFPPLILDVEQVENCSLVNVNQENSSGQCCTDKTTVVLKALRLSVAGT